MLRYFNFDLEVSKHTSPLYEWAGNISWLSVWIRQFIILNVYMRTFCNSVLIKIKCVEFYWLRSNIIETMLSVDVEESISTMRSDLDIHGVTELSNCNKRLFWWCGNSHFWSNIDCSAILALERNHLITEINGYGVVGKSTDCWFKAIAQCDN